MPVTIDVGGQQKTVNIDGFESMSPDEQREAAMQVAHTLDQTGPDESLGSALKAGAAGAVGGVGTAVSGLGGVLARNGLPGGETLQDAGHWVSQQAPAVPQGYQSGIPQILPRLRAGDYAGAGRAVLQAGAESVAPVGATLAAGMIGGPGAAAGLAGTMAEGQIAQQRAQNNGRAEPNTADMAQALPGAAVSAGAGVLGLGGLASGIANPILRAGAKIGLEAGAGAGQDAAAQLGGSVGTDKGASLDLNEMAGAGIGAGAARAASAPIAALGDAGRAAAKSLADMGFADPTVGEAQSITRVNQMFQERAQQTAALTRRSVPDEDVFNSIKSELTANVTSLGRTLRDEGLIDHDTFNRVVAPAIDQAMRHNKELAESGDGEVPTAFTALKSLPISPEVLDPLVTGLQDLSTLSIAARKNRMTGPGERLGRFLGQAAGVVGGFVEGGPIGAVAGVLGHSAMASVGGRIGSAVDSMMGMRKPEVVLRAERAQEVLKAAGVEPGANPLAGTDAAIRALRYGPAPDPATGLPTDPVPVGVPIPRGSVPDMLTRGRPTEPAEAPTGPTAPSLPPLPETPPTASTEAPTGTPGEAPPVPPLSPEMAPRLAALNYLNYRRQSSNQPPIAPDQFHQALNGMQQAGQLLPTTADHFRSGGGIDPGVAAKVLQYLQMANGGQSQGDAARPPVVDPLRWQAARADVKQHVAATADAAERAGDPELATTVRQVGASKQAADKAQTAADYLKTLKGRNDPIGRLRYARAVQVLADPVLMKGA